MAEREVRHGKNCRDIGTLITRPRRFGKTLNMSMVEKFFLLDSKLLGESEKEDFVTIHSRFDILFSKKPCKGFFLCHYD